MEFSDIAIFVLGVCLGAFIMGVYAVRQISKSFNDGFMLGGQLASLEINIEKLFEERDA